MFRGRTDMKRSRFTDEQFVGFLKQAEGGMPGKELYGDCLTKRATRPRTPRS
jgi:hypothetical protein